MLLKNPCDNVTPMLLLFLGSTIFLWHRLLTGYSHDILFLGMNRIDQNPKCGMFIAYWEETNIVGKHACCLWIRSEVLEFIHRSLQGILACMLCSKVLYWWCHCLALITLPVSTELSFSQPSLSIFCGVSNPTFPRKKAFFSEFCKRAWLSHTCSKNFGIPYLSILWMRFYPIMKWGCPVNPECLLQRYSQHKDLSRGNRCGAGVSVRTDLRARFHQSAVEEFITNVIMLPNIPYI